MDRARAVRLSMKCMTWIEKQAAALKATKVKGHGHDSAAVITIQQSDIQFVQVQEMKKHADMKNRRGKHQWWQDFKPLAEALGGRTGLVEGESQSATPLTTDAPAFLKNLTKL
jgi:6-phosphofructokinase 1